jgi:heme exporter protein D
MFENVQFSSLSDFFAMGGYAFNVWSVYLLFVVFFAINLAVPVIRKKQILREQKRRLVLAQESRVRRETGNDTVL